jgi:hypothetical protein
VLLLNRLNKLWSTTRKKSRQLFFIQRRMLSYPHHMIVQLLSGPLLVVSWDFISCSNLFFWNVWRAHDALVLGVVSCSGLLCVRLQSYAYTLHTSEKMLARGCGCTKTG